MRFSQAFIACAFLLAASAATAYRRVDPDEITGAVPKGGAEKCTGSGCGEYVAITCQR